MGAFCNKFCSGIVPPDRSTASGKDKPKNFLPIGMENANQIHTPNNLVYNDKLTARELSMQHSSLENIRANDEQQIKQTMEQNQINAVLNNSVYN